jgi:exodeoxyribonuclease V gamma subunit
VPLRVTFIRCLADIAPAAAEFLSRPGDPFQRQRIVVPHAGARAWLEAVLAARLGARNPADGDGIVANVEILFPGSIPALVQPFRLGPDPWHIDRLTFAVLHALLQDVALPLPFDRTSRPLLEARRLAARFDEYHVRRPGMIREWDRNPPNPVMSPTTSDEVHDGESVPDKLPAADRWQFDLWRSVRCLIGSPPPPVRLTPAPQAGRGPLLVAGIESLSLYQLQCLELVGEVCDVEVLLVHPSPGLERRDAAALPEPTPRLARRRDEPELSVGVDPLLAIWLAGTRNQQLLLAAQGVAVTAGSSDPLPTRKTLLHRMQATVAAGGEASAEPHALATDRSVTIHRCHNLARQAEVIHEALLHCFEDLPDLEPHEVVIVSPCIELAAAHLVAAFGRDMTGRTAAGRPATIHLPLVVADRGIRDVSPGAELLVAMLALPGSRCGVDALLEVAGHPLVRANFGLDEEIVTIWADLAERAEVRWGLDAAHRGRRGLAGIPEIHTWKRGLERILLAAALPDAAPRAVLGGVVPAADIDTADIPLIAPLVRIVSVIQRLEGLTTDRRPVAAWCTAIEAALADLCGTDSGDLVEPLACLRRLRDSAAGTAADQEPVPYDDVNQLVTGWLTEKAGRQPLRTGAITASSLVPLRGVPFRVLCVIGYDDGAVGVSEAEGDDLAARHQNMGDAPPGAPERRALLDCLLAASDRLLIACTGQNIKTNEPVPLVTPLAELVDFAVRHGVEPADPAGRSGIEILHPRHQLGGRNFRLGDVQPGLIWSHDPAALAVSARLGTEPEPLPVTTAAPLPSAPVVELTFLERLAHDPLRLHLEETLGIDTWRANEPETPATFPLAFSPREVRRTTEELLAVLVADPSGEDAWLEALHASGRLPIGPHGAAQLREIRELASGVVTLAAAKRVPLAGFVSQELRIDAGGARVAGHMLGFHQPSRRLVQVTTHVAERHSWNRPLHVAAVRLVAARAAGLDVEGVSILARNGSWSPGKETSTGKLLNPCQLRTIVMAENFDCQARLAELVTLAREALAEPRGLFGLGDTPRDKRREKFDDFVRPKFRNPGRDYAHSTEAFVYGLQPIYEQVFPPNSPATRFLDRYAAALTLVGKPGSSEYRLE